MSTLREAMRDLPEAVFADLLENETAYLLVLDLPGASADTVDVAVSNGRLSIEARREKSVPSEFRYLREDRSLFFDVEVPLPPTVSGDGAEATVDRGVLTLTLPKTSATGGMQVPVDDA